MDPILMVWIIIVFVISFICGWSMRGPREGYEVKISDEVDAAYIDLAPSRNVRAVAWSHQTLVECRENMGKVEAVFDFDIRGRLVGIEFIGLCTSAVLLSESGDDVQIGNSDTDLAKGACPPSSLL